MRSGTCWTRAFGASAAGYDKAGTATRCRIEADLFRLAAYRETSAVVNRIG